MNSSLSLRLVSFLATALASSPLSAQAPWVRQAPNPDAPHSRANSIAFAGTRGFVAGYDHDYVLETVDGGATWHDRALPTPYQTRVHFFDAQHGWLVGNAPQYRTVDGGATWQSLPNSPAGSYDSVDFVSPTHGWISAVGVLFATQDGGTTWTQRSLPNGVLQNHFDFVDTSVGLLSSGSGLFRTTNGGQSWTLVRSGVVRGVFFVDPTTALASVGDGTLGVADFARSTDGGQTWTDVDVAGEALVTAWKGAGTSVFASSSNYGAVSTRSDLWRSTDGGLTWSFVWRGIHEPITAGTFVDAQHGFATLLSNVIVETRDGGASWTFASNGVMSELHDVRFLDDLRGVAVGGDSFVVSTQDGGRHWTPARAGWEFSHGDHLRALDVLPSGFVFAAGDYGTMLKSFDGGLSWQTVLAPGPAYSIFDTSSVRFLDENEGWVAGGFFSIFHTLDGGQTWTRQLGPAASGDGIYAMDFVDAQHGWVVGTVDGTYATTDGGVHWSYKPFGLQGVHYCRAVDFVDTQTGWASGREGFVARTQDGGATWTRQTLPPSAIADEFVFSLRAVDAQEVWAASVQGRVFHTLDGGDNWSVVATNLPGASDEWNGIEALPSGNVWLAGARGAIARRQATPDVSGESFCAADGTATDHTAQCPCGNTGAIGHGCANSVSAAGARLVATGLTAADSIVLGASELPATSFTMFLQHVARGDTTFHDGVLCASGTLVRLRGRAAQAGSASFPDTRFANDATTTLSQRGGVAPGSGAVRYYSAWYRNASSTFCPPATANVSNGWSLIW